MELNIWKYRGRWGNLFGVLLASLFIAYHIVSWFTDKVDYDIWATVVIAAFSAFCFMMPSKITAKKDNMEITILD